MKNKNQENRFVKTEELMEGNYVCFFPDMILPSEAAIIKEVNKSLEKACHSIPVTEEWLIEFGFKKKTLFPKSVEPETVYDKTIQHLVFRAYFNSDSDKVVFGGISDFYLRIYNEDYMGCEHGIMFNELRQDYINQLQNIVFCLTGKKLKCKTKFK